MSKFDLSRLLIYALAAAGSVAAAFGYADFDAVSGVLDPKPINIYALFGLSGNGLAVLALIKGWGARK